MYCVLFLVLQLGCLPLIKILSPTFYSTIPEKKMKELGSYCLSTAHHITVVSYGWLMLYNDSRKSEEEAYRTDYLEESSKVVAFVFAYFTVDTLFYAIPQALKGTAGFT